MRNKGKQIVLVIKSIGLRRLLPVLCVLLLATAAMAQQSENSLPESRYAAMDGVRIHYQSYGEGSEGLVLIHGWSCNLDVWRDQISDFRKRTRVIAIDLPVHGQSDK